MTNLFIGAVVALMVGLLGFVLWDTFVRWPEYAREHHCTKTGATHHETHFQCHTIGKTTSCHPYTVTTYEWACDGGERVWR